MMTEREEKDGPIVNQATTETGERARLPGEGIGAAGTDAEGGQAGTTVHDSVAMGEPSGTTIREPDLTGEVTGVTVRDTSGSVEESGTTVRVPSPDTP
jgi:hypothetical protein